MTRKQKVYKDQQDGKILQLFHSNQKSYLNMKQACSTDPSRY